MLLEMAVLCIKTIPGERMRELFFEKKERKERGKKIIYVRIGN